MDASKQESMRVLWARLFERLRCGALVLLPSRQHEEAGLTFVQAEPRRAFGGAQRAHARRIAAIGRAALRLRQVAQDGTLAAPVRHGTS